MAEYRPNISVYLLTNCIRDLQAIELSLIGRRIYSITDQQRLAKGLIAAAHNAAYPGQKILFA